MALNGAPMGQVFQGDMESCLPANMVLAADQCSVTIREEALKEAFYGDCSDEDVTLAKARLVPQATAPLAPPIHTSEAKFGRIPRVYIECRRDRTLTPAFQKRLYTALCKRFVKGGILHERRYPTRGRTPRVGFPRFPLPQCLRYAVTPERGYCLDTPTKENGRYENV
jgi:hypothetical protein